MERSLALQRAQRQAFTVLRKGSLRKAANGQIQGMKPVPARNITTPATIRQELAYIATTSQYTFEFGSNAPVPTAALNNRVLGDNDIIAIYGIRIMYGVGANANNRVYDSVGITADDDSLYSGKLSIKLESTDPIDFFPMNMFRDDRADGPYNGLVLLNPLRIVSGKMSKVNDQINLRDISGLTITATSFVSVELVGAIAQA